MGATRFVNFVSDAQWFKTIYDPDIGRFQDNKRYKMLTHSSNMFKYHSLTTEDYIEMNLQQNMPKLEREEQNFAEGAFLELPLF